MTASAATISIVVPCYNSARFVTRTLDSVRTQTLTNWECVIVDDGSTDDSAQVVESHIAGESRMRLVRQPNGGVCNARNNGSASCSPNSKYLLFLDADDLIAPEMLEEMSKYLDSHPGVGMVFCGYTHIDSQGTLTELGIVSRYVPSSIGLRALPPSCASTPFVSVLSGMPTLPSFALLRRCYYEGTGGWDEWLGQHHEDLDLFLRMALQGPVHYVDRRMGFYRRHEGQSSQGANVEAHKSERFVAQAQKFDQKWSQGRHLSAQDQVVVSQARRFVRRRLAPWSRLCVARSLWQKKMFYPAARTSFGALLRYVGIVGT